MAKAQRMRFGIKTAPQHTTYEEILRVWQEADEQPSLEHAWLFDHFMPIVGDHRGPCLEGWSLLAALAARTSRIRVGLMVTGNTYRHPAVLANIGATVDIVSGGRLDLGIGAGWNEREHHAYSIPMYTVAERIRRLGEACEVIRRMWTETAPSFEGKYYTITEAYCEPKPVQKPHPPFVIGGNGERLTLRVAARHADIWNYVTGPVEEFKRLNGVLDEHCAVVGRNPAEIERSVQLLMDPADWEASRALVRGFIEAGATHVILNLRPPFPEKIAAALVSEIVAPLSR
jgi:F420-dependent oxidoreductase-like protein